MTTLAKYMDDIEQLAHRPILILDAVVMWAETQLDERGDEARQEIILECREWWLDYIPTDRDKQHAWEELGTCIPALITSGRTFTGGKK